MEYEWIMGMVGGGIIGIAVSLFLLLNGRVAGISGIVNGLVGSEKNERGWRLSFVLGLLFGGLFMLWFDSKVFFSVLETPWPITLVAGFLVGFGTVMGSGCTSGHGVCGISRLSVRSIVATVIFILAGMVTVRFVL